MRRVGVTLAMLLLLPSLSLAAAGPARSNRPGSSNLQAAREASAASATSSAPTEAPAGFDGESNGFAEEFCANQDAAGELAQLAEDPGRRVQFRGRRGGVHGPRDRRRRARADLQRRRLRRVPHRQPGVRPQQLREEARRRHQRDHGEAGRLLRRIDVQGPSGRIAHPESIAPSERAGAGAAGTQRDRVALHPQRPRRRVRRGDRERHAAGTSPTVSRRRSAASSSTCPCWRSPGATRIGRFGHKDQQASLVSFSADAYVNEMGITSPLQPDENTFNGVAVEDPVPGTRRRGRGRRAVRAVHAVDQGAAGGRGPRGDRRRAGGHAASSTRSAAPCATRRPSSPRRRAPCINGGALKVANALGNKIIHPFSDFLLHDLGTGDGIVQNGGQSTRNKMQDRGALGPAGARPLHARPAQLQPGGRDPAPRQPGRERRGATSMR